MTRKYSEENKEKFITAIREVNWDDLIPTVNAQNAAFTVFFNKLKCEYDKAFPIVKIKKNYNNRKPWLSPALRGSIKKKNKLYVKMHNRPTLHNTILYKQYRNKLDKLERPFWEYPPWETSQAKMKNWLHECQKWVSHMIGQYAHI